MVLLITILIAGEIDLIWDPPGMIGLYAAVISCSAAIAIDTAVWWWLYRRVRDWVRQ